VKAELTDFGTQESSRTSALKEAWKFGAFALILQDARLSPERKKVYLR
jgi:hypothetical protein